jgi:hypothetical protein
MSEWLPSPSALAVGRRKKTERQDEKEPMLFERSEFIGSRPAAQFSRLDRRSGGFFCFLFSAGGKKEVPVRHEDIPYRLRPACDP